MPPSSEPYPGRHRTCPGSNAVTTPDADDINGSEAKTEHGRGRRCAAASVTTRRSMRCHRRIDDDSRGSRHRARQPRPAAGTSSIWRHRRSMANDLPTQPQHARTRRVLRRVPRPPPAITPHARHHRQVPRRRARSAVPHTAAVGASTNEAGSAAPRMGSHSLARLRPGGAQHGRRQGSPHRYRSRAVRVSPVAIEGRTAASSSDETRRATYCEAQGPARRSQCGSSCRW